jgi:glutathione S-transferase
MIVFYDLASNLPHGFSPNTLKTRLSLAYKGLKHKTEWVEFPDIANVCKAKGIQATGTWKDGSPYYSVPAILDDHEGDEPPTAVADSFEIAKYLDARYPETKRIIPEGAEAEEFQNDFVQAFRKLVVFPFARVYFPHVAAILKPASKEYFSTKTAGLIFGPIPLEEILVKSAEEEAKLWSTFQEGWNEMEKYYIPTDEKGPWILGDSCSFADLVVGAYLASFQRVFGKESKEWQKLILLNGGRWGRLYDETNDLLKVEY